MHSHRGQARSYRFGVRSLSAHPPAPHVHMEMISVGRVVVRPEHRIELPAGAIPDEPQKPPVIAIILPVLEHRNPTPVCKTKACDVQRIGPSVLTEASLGAVIDVTAGKAAQMIDLSDVLPEYLLRRWL